MLAADGRAVTVLEADPDPVPAAPQRAWESWRRKGVARLRHGADQPHRERHRDADADGPLWSHFHPVAGDVRAGFG